MKHKNIAYISRSALLRNYRAIGEIVSGGLREKKPEVICVVKADAYGHGIETAAEVLGSAGCRFFAVSSEEEAAQLRALENAHGRHPEILILSRVDPENVPAMLEDDVTCAVVDCENAAELSAAVARYNRETGASASLKIHVKLDTGMNRVGFPTDEARLGDTVASLVRLAEDGNLRFCGIFTHFSVADDELLDGKLLPGYESFGGYTRMQLERFRETVERLEAAGVNPGLRHCANSAAILRLPEAYFDAVRAGVILYGLQPNGSEDPRFTPVMEFDSTVTHLHEVNPGEGVSYGATFRLNPSDKPVTLATVAAGYADGFERAYAGGTVKIGGRDYRITGRICMDQFMADVTPGDGGECAVKVGDRVTLFGGDDGASVNELARRAGTINYEVVCKVSRRVTRVVRD